MMSFKLYRFKTVLSTLALGLSIALLEISSSFASETDWGGVYPRDARPSTDPSTGECDRGVARGIRFQRYRYEDGDWDTYAFRLICTNDSQSNEFGPVRGQPVGDSYGASCPSGTVADGLRLDRRIRNQGDYHIYRFMLLCTDNADSGWVGSSTGSSRDIASVDCPRGEVIYGMRSWHWRHSDGDRDYYRFQLLCE